MIELADTVDHIILFSGDGDFRRLIEAVQRKGVRVTVISTIKSSPPMVADELRRQADHFLDLNSLTDEILRPQANKPETIDDGEDYDENYNEKQPEFAA